MSIPDLASARPARPSWPSSAPNSPPQALKRAVELVSNQKEASSMSVVTSLWASVQGDPVFTRRVNG